jgi:hypothetical protein
VLSRPPRGVQFALGPELKGGGQIKNCSEIYIDITVNWTSRMQDLAISRTSDFKIFPGDAPGPPNHSVRTWNRESPQVKVCPGPPNFPDCCAVYVRFGIFEYEL